MSLVSKPYIGCIIQARLTSTRLPRKHLLEIGGKTILENLINRVRGSKLIDKVVIASPHSPECCLNEEIFIGSENDVLDRYYQANKKYGFDVVVRLTADCPLVPTFELDRVLGAFLEAKVHYATNCNSGSGRFGIPDGWDVEVFSSHALEVAWLHAGPEEREHVTTFMKTNLGFHPLYLGGPKLSVDTEEDFERAKQFYQSESVNYQTQITETTSELGR